MTSCPVDSRTLARRFRAETGLLPGEIGPRRRLDQSIRIEMSGDLHEYGALGRSVTSPEAIMVI